MSTAHIKNRNDLRKYLIKGPFAHYTAACLIIRTKEKGLQPFLLNDNQRNLNEILDEQKNRTGRVRAIVLKGRQEGVSTYIQARFLRHTTTKQGKHAFILTHEKEATENLFGITERFYDNLPYGMAPRTGVANAKELSFVALDSGYSIGTAGNKAVGRSQTIHYFHGSEVGFWPNAEEHTKGILQAVPDANDTEIILESTANGVNNYFHRLWKAAEAREIDFLAVFLPWYWMNEYQKTPPDDFQLTSEEHELVEYYDLTPAQLCWRRKKIAEFNAAEDIESGIIAFRQEYPMNAQEAFQFSGGDTLITAEMCMAARKRNVEGWGYLYVGVDPSYGGDRFAAVWRHGPKMYRYEVYTAGEVATLEQRVQICEKILNTRDSVSNRLPDMMSIDFAVGKDIVDRLRELGYHERVRDIKFAEKPLLKQHHEQFGNRRNEIYGLLKMWLIDEQDLAQIPDTDEFQADLCATPYHYDIYERKALNKKEAIKKEYGFSPDLADAAALTFATMIYDRSINYLPAPIRPKGPDNYRQRQLQARQSKADIGKMKNPHSGPQNKLEKELQELKKKRDEIKAKQAKRQNERKFQ